MSCFSRFVKASNWFQEWPGLYTRFLVEVTPNFVEQASLMIPSVSAIITSEEKYSDALGLFFIFGSKIVAKAGSYSELFFRSRQLLTFLYDLFSQDGKRAQRKQETKESLPIKLHNKCAVSRSDISLKAYDYLFLFVLFSTRLINSERFPCQAVAPRV